MALVQGSDITTEAILERFQSTVVDPILSDAYHAGNIPTCRGYQCVPANILDHKENVNTIADIGQEGDIVSAEVVLAGLISLVRNLTRVGTFAFTVNMRHSESGSSYLNDPEIQGIMSNLNTMSAAATSLQSMWAGNWTDTDQYWECPTYASNGYRMKSRGSICGKTYDFVCVSNDNNALAPFVNDVNALQKKLDHMIETYEDSHGANGNTWTTEEASMSGKCIFTTAQVRAGFGAPGDKAGVEYGQIIRAANLNQLMANIYQHWYNSDRYRYIGNVIVCHTSCHFNCHSNCHFNCHSACHGWTIIKNA